MNEERSSSELDKNLKISNDLLLSDDKLSFVSFESDDVFENIQSSFVGEQNNLNDLQPLSGSINKLYKVISNMASDMSKYIMNSSLSNFGSSKNQENNEVCIENLICNNNIIQDNVMSPGKPQTISYCEQSQNKSFDTQNKCDAEEEEDDESIRRRKCSSQGIIEEWEPETSESGSYIIEGSSEHIGFYQPPSTSRGDNVFEDFKPEDCSDDDNYQNNDETFVAQLLINTSTADDIIARVTCDDDIRPSGRTGSPPRDVIESPNEISIITSPEKVDDRHKAALQRLVDLIANCDDFGNFKQQRSSEDIDKNESTKDKNCNNDGVRSKVDDNRELKLKISLWNYRLDKLLDEMKETNEHFIRGVCSKKAQNNQQGKSFDSFSCAGDNKEDGKRQDVVEFNRGLHCTSVSQAHDILTTRYKLGDIKKKRSLISWSKWNVAHIVRGPHAQSPIWKPGFLEEVGKSKNVMDELNRSIESREATLLKLADNQTIDYYTGLVRMCFERQQSIPDFTKLNRTKEELQNSMRKYVAITSNLESHQQQLSEMNDKQRRGYLSNSFTSFSTAPQQPQQSNHINCFLIKDLHSKRSYAQTQSPSNKPFDAILTTSASQAKPSIIDFLKQGQEDQTKDVVKTKPNVDSPSVVSKISDEGYDDDVFYHDDELKSGKDGNILTQCFPKSIQQIHHRSQPLLGHFYTAPQSLQFVSQQHRNKMKKKSQQRQRQLKNKLDATSGRKDEAELRLLTSEQNTPIQQLKSANVNCVDHNQGIQIKFNSLRRNKKSATLESNPASLNVQKTSNQVESSNVFSKFYHWFQDRVSTH